MDYYTSEGVPVEGLVEGVGADSARDGDLHPDIHLAEGIPAAHHSLAHPPRAAQAAQEPAGTLTPNLVVRTPVINQAKYEGVSQIGDVGGNRG